MSVEILGDRVLIRKTSNDESSAGGIVVLATPTDAPLQGRVLKVGEGRTTKKGTVIPLTVKVDDVVAYYPNAGISVKLDGEDLLVLREDEIYAVVDKDDK
jgi:chaperonin GroES